MNRSQASRDEENRPYIFFLALEIQILLSICTHRDVTETHHAHTHTTHAPKKQKHTSSFYSCRENQQHSNLRQLPFYRRNSLPESATGSHVTQTLPSPLVLLSAVEQDSSKY